MKYIIIALFLLSCSKETSFENSVDSQTSVEPRTSVYPTSVNLGPDITLYREFSTCVCRQEVYLNTCGVQPAYEAPDKGYEFYQISGPNQAGIDMNYSSPILCNLTYGVYKFVGHAWVRGFSACADSTFADEKYDTIQVSVLRKKRVFR